jgi:hypothetical protein
VAQGHALAGADAAGRSAGHLDGEFAAVDSHLDFRRVGPETKMQLAPAPLQRKRQFPPGRRQMGRDDNTIFAQLHAGYAEHHGLPEAAKRGHMDATGGVTHVVCQIDFSGLAKIGLRKVPVAEPGGDEGVDGGAQRTAMRRARLIVSKVGLVHGHGPLLPPQGAQ